jgi:cation:H+ antiporter
MDLMVIVMLVAGLITLIVGAEALVRGASRLAAALGISPLVIGLTVVAFGTSSPEMAVSVQSALAGQGDIALGNVIGSNVFNVLFILGISALITPLIVAQQLVRLDVPIMIGMSFVVWLMALNGLLERWEGILLFSGIIIYTVFLIWQSRRESKAIQEEYAAEYSEREARTWQHTAINVLLAVGGLALLVLGAQWFVDGATQLARFFGVSDLIIGLTIVAAGTSLPEVAASIVAALRGERDIAVGNVVGSNIFNLLAVLGLAGIVAPGEGIAVPPGVLAIDLPFMVAVAVACLPIFFTGGTVKRWEGVVFLGYYVAYTIYLILTASEHPNLPQYQTFLLVFIVPLTVLTIGVSLFQEMRRRRAATPV